MRLTCAGIMSVRLATAWLANVRWTAWDAINIARVLRLSSLYSPKVIHTLQQALWTDDAELFDKYAAMVEDDGPRTIRSLLTFRYDSCTPVPLDEVEPAQNIVRRFKTGAMSYGSISREAHECMAAP